MRLPAGTRLGPYEILAPLGAGGMGEVYRARDEKLDRDVAIKVLPESVAADPEALARFEREAKAVAALSHPNILSIFDYGTAGSIAYAVMELLEGDTLRDKLNAGPLPRKQALDHALQIARGFSAAHEKGVVHRDLKPENLSVTRDGHLKILDFGLAKRIEAVASDQTSAPTQSGHTQPGSGNTEPGTVMGTAGYMSPEQVRGLPADPRSDIFSFGAILYELLTGWRAFQKETPSDTMAAVLLLEPPDRFDPGREISPALDHLVRHCLEKDRTNRFQTARDVAFALSEASDPAVSSPSMSDSRAGSAIGSGAQPAAAAASGRGTRIAIVAVVAVLLAAAGLFFLRSPKDRVAGSRNIKRVAVLPFENQGGPEDDYFVDGIGDEVRTKLTSLSGVEVIARASSTPYKKTTKTPGQISRELGVGYLLTATVRWEKGAGARRVHVTPELVEVKEAGAPAAKWQQPFDAALTDVFQVQSDIASRVAQSLGVVLGAGEGKRLAEKPTQNFMAYDAYLKGRDAEGNGNSTDPASLRKALGFFEQSVALDPGFVQAWASVATSSTSLYANGQPTPALAERARQAAEKAIALAPDRADGYMALAGYHRLVQNDIPSSLSQYARAERIAPGYPGLLLATALAEEALGRWENSLDHLTQAVRLNPRSVPTRRVLGFCLLRLRRPVEAREAFDRVLELAPRNLDAIEYEAMTFLAQGDLPGARTVLRAAPKDVEATALVAQLATYYDLVWVLDESQRDLLLRLTPSAFDDDKGNWAFSLAEASALKGDAANVVHYGDQAVKAFEANVAATPQDADRHATLGVVLALLGRKAEAIREGERAVALDPIARDEYLGAYVQHQLVRIYILAGESEKAMDRLEPLLKMPYYLTPAWLRIDPNFDPLRKNPRFQKLVGGAAR